MEHNLELSYDNLHLKEQNFTFIGPGARLKGEFHLVGIIKLACSMEGTLSVQNGKITIERDGSFQGTIYCDDIEIFGDFEGQIESEGRVILQPSAVVTGNIHSKSFIVFPGAKTNIETHTKNP